MSLTCPDELIGGLVQKMQANDPDCLESMDALLAQFPEDARLHFMRGSFLIGAGRMIEGHDGLSRAVALAPDFAIARFQLGFFELTSGEASQALETWGRLNRLPDPHYLRKFVEGLTCLIRDDFDGAVGYLREGQTLNTENPPLNGDMQLLIDKCLALQSSETEDGDISETSFILNQFKRRNGGEDEGP